jgi:mono/diheme cytochrome c family protein
MTFAFHRGCAAFFTMLAASALNSATSADETVFSLGRKLFLEGAEPSCAICHTLADADAVGKVGPILDDLKPTGEQVAAAVTNGVGVMPPYEALTKAEVDALAAYVSEAAKGR